MEVAAAITAVDVHAPVAGYASWGNDFVEDVPARADDRSFQPSAVSAPW
ncbi:hypothetical protein [Paenarthrobacter nitroguajacolicus]|nr:hypothetical protein [Paenarthrobacter nitroguajacolicus]